MLALMEALPGPVVFFDAECVLCNRSVQWLMAKDEERRLKYAPLGGETAMGLKADGVLTEEHLGGKTMVMVERVGEEWEVRTRSHAVIRALGVAQAAPVRRFLLRMTPVFLREWGYRMVSRYRYRLFGKTDACLLPDEETAERVLP